MLVAHLSDMHLGYSQFNLEERENDVYDAFSQAIDISIREGVKAVVLAGDIFHSPRPEGSAIVKLGNELKKLKERNIRTFFILGEHDISRIRGVPVSYAFHNLGFATYIGRGEPVEFEDTLFIGFDKHRPGELDDLVGKLKLAGEQARKFSGRRVLVLHQGLLEINKFAGEITTNDLPADFTYYAMGHFHDRYENKFHNLGGPLAYPGSIEVTPSEGIKETEKGFYIVDLSGSEPRTHWQKLEIRPQIAASIKYDELAAGLEELTARIAKLQKKPVVRVTVTGKDMDSKHIANKLSGLVNTALHYRWDLIDQTSSPDVLDERPGDIESQLLELAVKELGSEDVAKFAVKELLPLLEAGNATEAFSLAWQAYERSLLGVNHAGEGSAR